MLLGVTAGISSEASAAQPYLRKWDVTINAYGESRTLTFTPEKTGAYCFWANSEGADTQAYLYNSDAKVEMDAEYYDDYSLSDDFLMYCWLDKGVTYQVYTYFAGSANIGSYTVFVDYSEINAIIYSTAKTKSFTEFTNGMLYPEGDFLYFQDDYLNSKVNRYAPYATGDSIIVYYTNGYVEEYTCKMYYDEVGEYYYPYFSTPDGKSFPVNHPRYITDQSSQWKVGTHEIYFCYGGCTSMVNVEIKAKGWYKSGTKWHYSKNGADLKGWLKSGGKWYYCNSKGEMVTGWLKTGGKWYYFNSSGAMVTGWQKIGGKWYIFRNSDGG